MTLWLVFVDVIRAVLLSLAHVAHGSVGAGILALSVLVRLILLPLAIKVALRGLESAERLRAIEPELKRMRERHKADPAKLWAETRVLHQKHNVRLMPKGSLTSMFIQLPLGMAVYRVVTENASRAGRFLWMSDLARPDFFITSLAAGIASLAILLAPTNNAGNKSMAVLTAVFTVVMVWKLAAGVGLYWVGMSSVGVAQSLIVRGIIARRRVTRRP